MARGGKREGSGRPQGAVNRATADIREAAQVFSEQALQVLVQVATEGESEAARVAAANAILDRAHGKPKQAVDVEANVVASVRRIELVGVRPDGGR
jgi:hypothetical protein